MANTAFTPVGRTTNLPSFTDAIRQEFFVEPLSGPTHPQNYLDRFPDSIYNKAPDTHFIRFMYTLLGPAGVGWLRQNALEARLYLADNNVEVFDLEKYFANPFRFGRVLAESHEEDPTGLLPREQWDLIRAQDESYRSRVTEYFNAARAGNTLFGMELAARSGIGRNVRIVENYQSLFDIHSDDPKGYEYFGSTLSTSEFIVVPRLDVSRSEQQKVEIMGAPTAGNWVLIFNGQTTSTLDWDATANEVQSALQALQNIGDDNVRVSGGPGTISASTYLEPYVVTFTGDLAGQDLPRLKSFSALTGGVSPTIEITTIADGVPSVDEAAVIDPELQHNLQSALDYLKPVDTFFSVSAGSGTRTSQPWKSVASTSESYEILRYVRGNPDINWPAVNSFYWIEAGKEKEAPRIRQDRPEHYVGFHSASSVTAYTDAVLDDATSYAEGTNVPWDGNYVPGITSEHVGVFSDEQIKALPLRFTQINPTERLTADRAMADYAEPLTVSAQSNGKSLVNGIYPADHAFLQNVPQIKYKDDQFWASIERPEGTDYLEIDLGSPQPVNFMTFEITNKPFDVGISYDTLDAAPLRRFVDVKPAPSVEFSKSFRYNDTLPWSYAKYNFTDNAGQVIFARFIRISFTRMNISTNLDSRFLYDAKTDTQHGFSVEVKNLRVGRNG